MLLSHLEHLVDSITPVPTATRSPFPERRQVPRLTRGRMHAEDGSPDQIRCANAINDDGQIVADAWPQESLFWPMGSAVLLTRAISMPRPQNMAPASPNGVDRTSRAWPGRTSKIPGRPPGSSVVTGS
jgi:hypothetical protein